MVIKALLPMATVFSICPLAVNQGAENISVESLDINQSPLALMWGQIFFGNITFNLGKGNFLSFLSFVNV